MLSISIQNIKQTRRDPKNASRVQPNHQEKSEACQKQREQDKNTNRQKEVPFPGIDAANDEFCLPL